MIELLMGICQVNMCPDSTMTLVFGEGSPKSPLWLIWNKFKMFWRCFPSGHIVP